MRRHSLVVALVIAPFAVGLFFAGCKRDAFEEETASKHVNKARRVDYTDKEWSQVFDGKVNYEKYCSGCHGMKGDGKGPAAAMLLVKPRNFTRGMFKFISTPSGSLPCDADLERTLMRGVPRSSMPSWSMLTEIERTTIIMYLKTFSDRWKTSPPPSPLAFSEPPAWVGGLQSVAAGKDVYKRMGCANCHGESGMADGMSSGNLTDAEGNKIVPFNFTDGVLKGGGTVKDIYRTFYTGLAGTPMPAYGGILSDAENWQLVSYVLYMMRKTNVSEADLTNAAQAAATKSTPTKAGF